MNHQVQDDGDVGAARLERRQAFGLQKPWLVQVGRGRADGAVESLHVADLQAQPALPRGMHQGLGPRQGVGQRFFDQGMNATLQNGEADVDVCRRRHHHRYRLHAIQQRLERGEGGGLELLGDVRGARRVVIVEAHEIGAGDLLQEPDMVEAERAGPDDSDPDRPHRGFFHTITPRCDASMNRRNVSTSGTCGSSVRARATPWLTVRSELKTRR